MNQFLSRVLVTVVGLPVVLGFIYLGGWWLFGLALSRRSSRCTSST